MRYQRIKELCKKVGVTVTGLENELGFARGSLSKIDQHVPSADKVRKIAERLGSTPDYILYGTLEEHKSISGKSYYFDDQTAQLAQDLFSDPKYNFMMSGTRKITPEQFNVMQSMLKEFLRKDGKIDN